MSVAVLTSDEAVAIGADAGVLGRIMDADIHLAVWRREMPAGLTGLSALDWDAIDDIDETVAAESLAQAAPLLLEEAGYADTGPPLAAEIVVLGEHLAAVMRRDLLRVRLEVIETDACRRFHTDYVTARLLMPLVGPGTQWIRSGSDGPVDALRPGDVGLFKGRQWAEEPIVLHRSPPVAATGETRLLLALDPLA